MTDTPKYWPAGGTTIVETLTTAAQAFVAEHSRLLDFSEFLLSAVLDRCKTAENAVSALVRFKNEHERLLRELVITRTVDNFLCYISDLLALIYSIKPQMLRSAEQERLDFILQFTDMNQLRSAIAEKRVERLAYLGVRELSEYTEEHMSFRLFESEEQRERAALIVEYRNICVHARGIVGRTSTRRFPVLTASLDQPLLLTSESVTSDRKFIEDCVFAIDERAIQKFSLPALQVPEPPADL